MPLDFYNPLTQGAFGFLHSIVHVAELELNFCGQLSHLLLKLLKIINN